MQSRKRNIISQFAGMVLSAVLATVALSSCERIFEDLDPCPHGVSLRFVYDYNMEFANAFPRQVDCLTLYIYDDKDNYVDTRIVTGTELQDEDYRMTLEIIISWHTEGWRATKVLSPCCKRPLQAANGQTCALPWMLIASPCPSAATCMICFGDNSPSPLPTSIVKEQ